MNMNARARKFYKLVLATDPDVIGWELSLDGGLTWEPGEDVPAVTDLYRWLFRGPDFVPQTGDAVASIMVPYSGVVPLLRFRDTPEAEIERGPAVFFK